MFLKDDFIDFQLASHCSFEDYIYITDIKLLSAFPMLKYLCSDYVIWRSSGRAAPSKLQPL